MSLPLHVLMIEDSEDDVQLSIHALKKGGYEPTYERVEDALAMRKTIETGSWDVILCDYQMPKFDGLAAIALLKETGTDIPLIIVSGAIGEEMAVECMRLGACDYVMKGNLSRLGSAIKRELQEAESRLQRKRAEEELRTSKSQLSNALEMAHLGHWEYDVVSDLFTFNDQFYKIFRTAVDQVGGYTMHSAEYAHRFVHRDDMNMVGEETRKAVETTDPNFSRQIEHRMLYADGTVGYITVRFFIVKDSHGRTVKTYGVNQDITEHREAEQKLKDALESLRRAVNTTIQVMVSAVETRDPYTAGHQTRSADLARAIATNMGLPQQKIEGIRMAASIHDIGKLSIPAEILSKPTKLTDIEFRLIKEHALKGYEMLKDVESQWPLAQIVYQHHERMDGSGYPRYLKGDEILIEARILAVADVVEAMASHRPYRPGLGMDAALNEIEKNRGIFYDSAVADACLRLFREKGFKLEGA
jgi:HD-GYP domain-containing protein (c-di-GMP phosphodiesterase class II)